LLENQGFGASIRAGAAASVRPVCLERTPLLPSVIRCFVIRDCSKKSP
jgi:hypothetical protein